MISALTGVMTCRPDLVVAAACIRPIAHLPIDLGGPARRRQESARSTYAPNVHGWRWTELRGDSGARLQPGACSPEPEARSLEPKAGRLKPRPGGRPPLHLEELPDRAVETVLQRLPLVGPERPEPVPRRL